MKNELEKEKKDKEKILSNVKEDEKSKEALMIEYELTQQNLLKQIQRLEQNFFGIQLFIFLTCKKQLIVFNLFH